MYPVRTTQSSRRRRATMLTRVALTPAVLTPLLLVSLTSTAPAADEPGVPGTAAVEPLFVDDFTDGVAGWQAIAGSLDEWSTTHAEFSYVTVDTRDQAAGRYLVPAAEIDLPEHYEVRTRVRFEAATSSPTVNLLTDFREPLVVTERNLAAQITGPGGIRAARPLGQAVVCSGAAPIETGEWHDLLIRRAGDISVIEVDGQPVAAVDSPTAGGTVGIGVYHARASFASVAVHELSGIPDGHPTEATGCEWHEPEIDQPIMLNQSGFNLTETKRFTAPRAEDGAPFTITDESGTVRYEGTVNGGVGDFTEFDPPDVGPFTVAVDGAAGSGESVPFGIGAFWLERVSYRQAIAFMTDVRCYYGRMDLMAHGGTDPANCLYGVGWRDSHQFSYELNSLVDLYLANPSAFEQITDPDAVYVGLPEQLPVDTPEIARLIHWAVEVYLDGEVNHTMLKEQLASFLYAYPHLEQHIPRDVYERARDYLFPLWDQPAKNRFAWHEYTDHTADLLQVYTQIGTGKGEFPVGHSIWPNVMMYEVAVREGHDDAHRYLQAAHDQTAWILENVDPSDPRVTKGQRQGEHHLITALTRFTQAHPDAAPAGVEDFVRAWAQVVVDRSDNLWDFRRYSGDRWTIPSFTGGGASDPNETGNVAGFAAPALAAVRLLGDEDLLSARLRGIATAHVDNIFGRNPTGRHASHRGPTEQWGFEGVDVGWYTEYQGGAGRLQGARGVLDGSPKNDHYPYNPSVGNIGHSEGWVTFNTAWNTSLAWRAADTTDVTVHAGDGSPVTALAPGETATITLTAPLNLHANSVDEGLVDVHNGDADPVQVQVRQTDPGARTFTGLLDLDDLGAEAGDVVTVSYGFGSFATSVQVEVDACPDGFPADETIRFGTSDSGVPNYDRGDGCTFLDVVWQTAPFDGQGDLVRSVRTTANDWRAEGLLDRAEAQAIVAAAAGSRDW
ncbi:hypothetical protein [Phytoactinopolyspora limicola]|uniref:hypothetical protein n=1 Tax=Phytoactinopolyspora limicola TaxID=2715536 RepID=UPI0014077969|nr:hypothetical protein [Phytoactinopolyspora limicola]